MRAWLIMFGGMAVWTVHFFSLYILASVFGSGWAARLPTLVLTLVALAVNVWLMVLARRRLDAAGTDRPARWMATMAGLAALLSLVAVLWQGLPALFARG